MGSHLAEQLGVEVKMHEGRRITDAATLDIAVMAYAGLANKRVVAALQARGVNACGLSGCDMAVVKSHRRPVKDIDWGFVGDVDEVNANVLSLEYSISSEIILANLDTSSSVFTFSW